MFISLFSRLYVAIVVGIDKFGMGNWKGISEYIGTKSLKQVDDHYWDLYMGRHGYCLPPSVVYDEEEIPIESFINKFTIQEVKDKLEQSRYCNVNEGYTLGKCQATTYIISYDIYSV